MQKQSLVKLAQMFRALLGSLLVNAQPYFPLRSQLQGRTKISQGKL
jgi:hypothetical protein